MIKCPKCGNKVIIKFNGREIINKCSKCDYEVVTTFNSKMDLDNTKYIISISKNNNSSLNNIKLISKLTGDSFIKCKNYLQNGYSFDEDYASKILEKKKILDKNNINYIITPKFPYCD